MLSRRNTVVNNVYPKTAKLTLYDREPASVLNGEEDVGIKPCGGADISGVELLCPNGRLREGDIVGNILNRAEYRLICKVALKLYLIINAGSVAYLLVVTGEKLKGGACVFIYVNVCYLGKLVLAAVE